MTNVYIASLLLVAGLAAIFGYLQSLGAIPLYLKISQVNSSNAREIEALRTLWSSFTHQKSLKKQDLDFLFQLPDFLDLFSVALASGESVHSALSRVVPRMNGVVATEFEQLLLALELGSDFETELTRLSVRNSNNPLSEVANRMLLSIRRGSPLALLLSSQATFVRNDLHNQMLKQSGRNETRMLIPLVFLILPVTILFAIFPSLEMLGGIYI
jgi:tight adherence protein C